MKIWMFAPLLLCGCVTSKPVSLPNGNQGFAIDCGAPFDITDCMNEAAKKCGGRYEVVAPVSESQTGVIPVGGMLVQAQDRILIVSCEKMPL